MRLQDYLRVIRKRWWLILLVMVSAAGTAYVISKAQTPIYRSRANVGVVISRDHIDAQRKSRRPRRP